MYTVFSTRIMFLRLSPSLRDLVNLIDCGLSRLSTWLPSYRSSNGYYHRRRSLLRSQARLPTRVHSRKQRVTLNNGEQRPSWFDIAHLPPYRDEFDEVAINEAIRGIEGIIQQKVQEGVDPKRIILIGFSQGAAVGLMVGLTTLHELAGVASLSGWIPHRVREVSHLM